MHGDFETAMHKPHETAMHGKREYEMHGGRNRSRCTMAERRVVERLVAERVVERAMERGRGHPTRGAVHLLSFIVHRASLTRASRASLFRPLCIAVSKQPCIAVSKHRCIAVPRSASPLRRFAPIPSGRHLCRLMRITRNLTFQVLVAVAIAVVLGALYPAAGVAMKPLGDIFINLVKMIIAPIIFLTIVLGIASMHDIRKVGRVGGKAFLYFEVVTTIALAIGLLVANITKPGAGIDVSSLAGGDISQYTTAAKQLNFVDFVTHIVPSSIVGAFANGDILQIVFFSLLFGVALSGLGESGRAVTAGLEKLAQVFFRVTAIVMRVAP